VHNHKRLSIHVITNSVALVRERTIPTEQQPLVGEVSANFCGGKGVAWSVRRIPYGRNLDFLDQIHVITYIINFIYLPYCYNERKTLQSLHICL
jgi:hypothetical protein